MARILVIDDDVQVRDMLKEMLGTSGHAVTVAPDGESGIALHREHPFELVIADIFMPGKEGIEVIRDLRAGDPGVKIIALSGGGNFHRFDVLEASREVGASVTLRKPVDWEELVTSVNAVLGAHA